MIVIETERLTLRRLVPEDVEELTPIFADAETMRYYPAPFSRERTQAWIDWNLRLYSERGHGLWALVRRGDGLFLGDCGVVPQLVEGAEVPEVGYHVRRDQWGQGYASEAALVCREYALRTLGAPQVVSIVNPLNMASRAVAAKIHRRMRLFVWEKNGHEMCLYSTP